MNGFEFFVETASRIKSACPKKPKHLYLVGFDDGSVKIGVSQDPSKRIATIERQAGRRKCNEIIFSSTQGAFAAEADFKRKFKPLLLNGEVYNLNFEAARAYINRAHYPITSVAQ